MLITKTFSWKEFLIDLENMHSYLRAALQNYSGMSAGADLQIHFSAAPSSQDLMRVQQYLDSLTKDGEAAKIAYRQKLERTVAYAYSNLPYVDFAQMIAAEKKLFLKQDLTLAEKVTLLQKYPNV